MDGGRIDGTALMRRAVDRSAPADQGRDCPQWVINGLDRAETGLPKCPREADIHDARWHVSNVPEADDQTPRKSVSPIRRVSQLRIP